MVSQRTILKRMERVTPKGFVERMAVVNEVVALFAPGTRVEWRAGKGMFVLWKASRPPLERVRRWQVIGGGHHPVWHRLWGHGGTCCHALSQLIRWAQGKPVLPLSTWRYWTSDTVGLGRERGPQIVRLLTAGGYPADVACVLCGQRLVNGIDWWDLDGVSGPCCRHGSCRSHVTERR